MDIDLSLDKEITEGDQEASVIKFVNQIIRESLVEKATDIHVEPLGTDLRIRYRIDGIPQREIAGEIGISLSAVEKHLQRAYRTVVETRERLDADVPCPQRPIGAEGP